MQPNYDELMWKSFDRNFKLNYTLILVGMTAPHIEKSSHIVNTFGSHEVETGELYVKIASLLLKEESIENDIIMPLSATQFGITVHSINLKNYFDTSNFQTHYTSVDDLIPKNSLKKSDIHDDFSFILGFYIRYYNEEAFWSVENKRLYILTALIEGFGISGRSSVTLTVSNAISKSHVTIDNEGLLERLKKYAKLLTEK